jgi:hypothetical protein
VPRQPIKPPLETAIDSVARELRVELDKSKTAIEQLKAELATAKSDLATLKQRYNQHTHGYTHGNPGSAGNMWFSLGQMRGYFGDDQTTWDNFGVYLRGGPVAGTPGPIKSDPPNPTA